MKTPTAVSFFLAITGVLVVFVGGSLLLDPVGFEASAGLQLGRDASLLSEFRAPGGALLAGGIVIALGAFISRMAPLSTLVAAVILLSYGLSRIVGIALDGIPSATLLAAMAVELGVGVVSLLVLRSLVSRGTTRGVTG